MDGFIGFASGYDISSSTATNNGGDGFDVEGANSVFTDCTASGNAGFGFEIAETTALTRCTSLSNDGGFYIMSLSNQVNF